MKPCELQTILARAVEIERPWPRPPEALIITGIQVYDAQLHYVLNEFGVEVKLDNDYNMKDYLVVDEQKFAWFLLRWA
jgi:hypothetical protein